MHKETDFVIKRGSLLAYIGSDPVVRVPRGVTNVARLAFADRADLVEVILPKGVQYIETGAFLECTALRSVTLPESLLSIGPSAFNGCEALEEITLPESLLEIGPMAFSGCEALRSIALPAGLEALGAAAFHRCLSLKRIALPAQITEIPERLFQFCFALSEVGLPPHLYTVGAFAFSNTAIRSLQLPEGLQLIRNGAFSGCTSLEKITLPGSLVELETCAFSGCSRLKALTIPFSVARIGAFALACESLESLRFEMPARNDLRADVFGYRLPEPLYPSLEALWPMMTDGALKQYVLTERGWAALSTDERSELFYDRHGKALLPAYSAVTGLSVEDLVEIRKDKAPLGRVRPAVEAEVLREEQVGALTKRRTASSGLIWEAYLADTDRAKVKLAFIMGRDTPETRETMAAGSIVGLGTTPRSGLAALLRRSAEPDEPGDAVPDGELGGVEGNFSTTLAAEGGRLIYTVEPCCAGCGGSARIDLGAATAARVEKMQRACDRFQEEWLLPFAWAVKHSYIDNGGYEE